uniref:Uncharacterized protein n=1 Tax=Anguilla anguilla TaxID=7936 RepID=A0A0E9VWL2_ANGAN
MPVYLSVVTAWTQSIALHSFEPDELKNIFFTN